MYIHIKRTRYKKPRILVTGATGKTGRVVVDELLAKGVSLRLAMPNERSKVEHGAQFTERSAPEPRAMFQSWVRDGA